MESPESTRATEPHVPLPASALEELVAAALDRLEAEGSAGVERLLAEHPDHAPALRQHLSRLHHLGLVDDSGDDGDTDRHFPEQLGDFRLIRRLGGGGMGVVYLAEQRSLGREVALKLIRSEHLYFGGARERFRREIEAVARLQHPAIVPVYATGQDDGVPWLAMEHIDGTSLGEVMQALAGRDPATLRGSDLQTAIVAIMQRRNPGTPVPTGEAFVGAWAVVCLRMARQVAEALDHAHQRGVLHRDVKPSNLMLTPDGRVRLLDFGLARTDDAVQLTRTGNLVGTPAYMSPEQMRGEIDRIDERTDVYALGVTLFELLTLRSPFGAPSTEATRQLVMDGTPVSLRRLNPAVPPDVEIVCRKAMDLEPERRYASAASLAEDLANVLELRPIRAQAPSPMLIVRRWAQRRPALAIAIVATFLIGFVAPTAFYVQQRSANQEISNALAVAETERDHARESLAVATRDRRRAREAVETMLSRVANESLLDVPRMQGVRRDLLISARAFHEQFLQDSENDPELLSDVVGAARMLSVLDGELGRVEQALSSAARAVHLARKLSAASPGQVSDQLVLARNLLTLGAAHFTLSHLLEALAAMDEALALLRQYRLVAPDDLELTTYMLVSQRSRAAVLFELDQIEAMNACYQEIAAIWADIAQRIQGTPQRSQAFEFVLGASCDEANYRVKLGDEAKAREVLARCEALSAGETDLSESLRVSLARMQVVKAQLSEGQLKEACLREALSRLDLVLAANPESSLALRMQANVSNSLGLVLMEQPERRQEAFQMVGASIALLQRLVDLDPAVVENQANLAANRINLGSMLQDDGDFAAALASFTAAAAPLRAALAVAPNHKQWQEYDYNRIWFLAQVSAHLDDHHQVVENARQLAALRPDDAKTQRIAAGLLGNALPLVLADTAMTAPARRDLQTTLQADALALLRRAAELGCADCERLSTGSDFDSLRDLDGFAAIQAMFAENQRRAAGGDK